MTDILSIRRKKERVSIQFNSKGSIRCGQQWSCHETSVQKLVLDRHVTLSDATFQQLTGSTLSLYMYI